MIEWAVSGRENPVVRLALVVRNDQSEVPQMQQQEDSARLSEDAALPKGIVPVLPFVRFLQLGIPRVRGSGDSEFEALQEEKKGVFGIFGFRILILLMTRRLEDHPPLRRTNR